MAFISITRARVRAIRFVPSFALAALKSLKQAERATGFLGGAVLPDQRLTFWTMTVWKEEAAMRAYILSGSHRRVMPKFANWCDEASVVHWTQPDAVRPSWASAGERMLREGRPSKVRRPSADHECMAFAPPPMSGGAAIFPKP